MALWLAQRRFRKEIYAKNARRADAKQRAQPHQCTNPQEASILEFYRPKNFFHLSRQIFRSKRSPYNTSKSRPIVALCWFRVLPGRRTWDNLRLPIRQPRPKETRRFRSAYNFLLQAILPANRFLEPRH